MSNFRPSHDLAQTNEKLTVAPAADGNPTHMLRLMGERLQQRSEWGKPRTKENDETEPEKEQTPEVVRPRAAETLAAPGPVNRPADEHDGLASDGFAALNKLLRKANKAIDDSLNNTTDSSQLDETERSYEMLDMTTSADDSSFMTPAHPITAPTPQAPVSIRPQPVVREAPPPPPPPRAPTPPPTAEEILEKNVKGVVCLHFDVIVYV